MHKELIIFLICDYIEIIFLSVYNEKHEICNVFTRRTEGAMYQRPIIGKELVHMVAYDDLFQFVIMLCVVITLVVTLMKRKK